LLWPLKKIKIVINAITEKRNERKTILIMEIFSSKYVTDINAAPASRKFNNRRRIIYFLSGFKTHHLIKPFIAV
jgi:hypothetical protein